MKVFKATVQIMGFIEVQVDAKDKADAIQKIKKDPERHQVGDVTSVVFNEFETGPTVDKGK